MAYVLDNISKVVNTTYNLAILGAVGFGAYAVYETVYGDPCAKDTLLGKATSVLPFNPLCEGKSVIGFFTGLKDIGAGVPVELEPCPDGYVNDGLTCRKPIDCASGLDFFSEGCSGGQVIGRLDNGGVCPPDHPDRVDGLCYKSCPSGYVHTEGMPYTCRPAGQDFFSSITSGIQLPSWLS